MNDPSPHYLLLSETSRTEGLGHWRFVLRPASGTPAVEVADVEPDIWGERLDLLTVVRALESLDQPSRVTLIGCTRYIEQGIQFGLSEWRENQWRWEYFGQMTPIRDADLWQRMDRILQFHRVDCGQRRFDAGHCLPAGHHIGLRRRNMKWLSGLPTADWVKHYAPATGGLVCAVLGSGITVLARGRTNGGRLRLVVSRSSFLSFFPCKEVRVRTTASLETIGQLIEGRHENPFELLGPHEVDQSGRRALAVRAFLPNSEQAWVVDPAHANQTLPMRRIHPAGLFEAICPLP